MSASNHFYVIVWFNNYLIFIFKITFNEVILRLYFVLCFKSYEMEICNLVSEVNLVLFIQAVVWTWFDKFAKFIQGCFICMFSGEVNFPAPC